MNALENLGLVTRIGNNRKLSFEYQINVWNDYDMIKDGVNLLDEKLAELREKYPTA